MEKVEVLLYSLTILFYFFSNLAGYFSYFFKKEKSVFYSFYFFYVALFFNTLTFFFRWIYTKHIPTIGNYENVLMGSWVLGILILFFLKKGKKFLPFHLSISLNLALLGFGFFYYSSPSPLYASLKSIWLFIHIIFAWLAHGAFILATGVAIAYLIKKEEKYEELMLRTTAFGFVFDGLMIVAGSIWAKNLWGSYWSWDPVETWSLISFLLYGLILHLKITLKIKPKIFAIMLIASLITVIISFWGVNFFMEKSLHIFNVG